MEFACRKLERTEPLLKVTGNNKEIIRHTGTGTKHDYNSEVVLLLSTKLKVVKFLE